MNRAMKATLMVAVLAVSSILAVSAVSYDSDADDKGKCGDTLRWTYLESLGNKYIAITGTGWMYDYERASDGSYTYPWADYEFPTIQFGNSSEFPKAQSVGNYAFAGTKVNKVVWYNEPSWERFGHIYLEMIGDHAFYQCKDLRSFTIGNAGNRPVFEYLRSIGDYAFADCVRLQNFNLAAVAPNLNYLGEYAFKNCTSIKQIIIPNSLAEIQEGTFKGCTSLESIVIPANVMEIGPSAFEGCTSLKSVTFEAPSISIYENAFAGCTSLESVTFADAVTVSVYEGAFKGTKITTFDLDKMDSVYIEDRAFEGCASLTDVNLSSDVVCVYEDAFKDCGSLDMVMIIADEIELNDRALGGSGLAFLRVAAGTLTMGDGVLEGCARLNHAAFTADKASMGDSIFKGCASLDAVTFRVDDLTLSSGTLDGSSLNSIEIKSKHLADDDGARPVSGNRSGLETLVITNFKITIPEGTFEGCTDLEYIRIEPRQADIGERAFAGCTSLTGVVLGPGVSKISAGMFDGCRSILSIKAVGEIAIIGDCAFRGCESAQIFLGGLGKVTKIGDGAFEGCKRSKLSPETIDLASAESLGIIGKNAFLGCLASGSIDVPKNVQIIGEKAFADVSGVRSVNILSDDWRIKEIGSDAFAFDAKGKVAVYSKDNMADHKLDGYGGPDIKFEYRSAAIGYDPDGGNQTTASPVLVAAITLFLTAIFIRRWF